MTANTAAGSQGKSQAGSGSIDQAVALRDAFRASISKTDDSVRSFRRQPQLSRLLRLTLASLKQLQQSG
jgi:hypothetical protein